MKKIYDVVVIGSGVAGQTAASGLAFAGKNVAIVENDLWGGTCANRGCDPKKILFSVVEAHNKSLHLIGKGIEEAPIINWSQLIAFKNTFTDPVPEQSKKRLKASGIDVYNATAEFIDAKNIKVQDHILEAAQFVIATGARPALINIEGKEHFLTSDDFLSLPNMPDKLTFIGGGYIAFEFAAIANAAGAQVDVIHHNSRPLKAYDQELVSALMSQLEAKGVIFHLDTNITLIEKVGQQFKLTDDKGFELTTDLVFATTGRLANTEKLKLENADVTYDKKGIIVNDYLQTSNPAIYALGDVLSKKQPKLTPVSSLEASYLVSLLTNKNDCPIAYPKIPTNVFSSPKLAQVGVTVLEAENSKDKYEVSTIDASNWFNYLRVNEPVSKVNIIIDKDSGLLAGASCLNNEADQLINFFTFFINKEIKAAELADAVFAYPTIASDLTYFYT
ncbi:glutathione reductase (NADPH) [Trichococcus patagoniensis]|uniref:Glutathione reductase (NADPH) n=1 Tax=Trichococcus patagoniensis TaxID=382641 RepID=A0A2T5I7L1_9LACT|nr:NAD(P)/FAD-dependent oxidoreductase [Trichococcus patagoniensis]PTQ79792.1 glutathione reductase (NADPH) [Trichococcus patagoniensis]